MNLQLYKKKEKKEEETILNNLKRQAPFEEEKVCISI